MIASPAETSDCHLRAGAAIPPKKFEPIRRRMLLDFCKWDPQIEDVCTLAEFPIYISRGQWRWLARCAERLTQELVDAERRVIRRPELFSELAIPRRLTPIIAQWREEQMSLAGRVMRFDFHSTANGWKISEVNSDVPGGYTESTSFARLMADESGGEIAGLPGEEWTNAITQFADGHPGGVLLLSAAGFIEDLQIVSYIAQRLRERGVEARVIGVDQLATAPAGVIVRFFQAEWLGRRCYKSVARQLLGPRDIPVMNPGYTIVSESKRFPLIWERLGLPMPVWRSVLPETLDPRDADWKNGDWLLKTAFCNTGDTVSWPGQKGKRDWQMAKLHARLSPRNWIAQRRFDCQAIDTPRGKMFPCLGVYTVGGKACGIYGRLSFGRVVDFQAIDVAVLIGDEE
jgi:glutathionylspermidine synthase